jgi:nicotinic acid mononucleotide adenylyltransferase
MISLLIMGLDSKMLHLSLWMSSTGICSKSGKSVADRSDLCAARIQHSMHHLTIVSKTQSNISSTKFLILQSDCASLSLPLLPKRLIRSLIKTITRSNPN